MAPSAGRILMIAGACLTAGCSLISPEPRGGVVQKQQPSLGYMEHRGRQYDLRDLMDPAYRASSKDDFARHFNPDTAFVQWRGAEAGLQSDRVLMGDIRDR